MTVEEAGVARDSFPRQPPETPPNVFEQLSMKGKVVAITGAADGIGYAVAEAMAEAGGDVALWYNSNDAAISKGERLAKAHGIRAKALVQTHLLWVPGRRLTVAQIQGRGLRLNQSRADHGPSSTRLWETRCVCGECWHGDLESDHRADSR